MILKYGTYAHALAEAALVIRKQAVFNDAQVIRAVRERWDIDGLLQRADQPALTAAIHELLAAYSVQGQDAALYLDDGTTLTSHWLQSAAAIGGVRVLAIDCPRGQGAEYSTFRAYHIALAAEFPSLGQDSSLVSWDETLNFTGGGERFILLQTLNGPAQRQLVADQTPYHATQTGRAVGYLAYPLPGLPIWPQAEHVDRRRIVRRAPRRSGPSGQRAYTEWEVTWSYEFESDGPLVGDPTAWT